jgi:hypothetical protein
VITYTPIASKILPFPCMTTTGNMQDLTGNMRM